jgi:NAD-dependent deacetylase
LFISKKADSEKGRLKMAADTSDATDVASLAQRLFWEAGSEGSQTERTEGEELALRLPATTTGAACRQMAELLRGLTLVKSDTTAFAIFATDDEQRQQPLFEEVAGLARFITMADFLVELAAKVSDTAAMFRGPAVAKIQQTATMLGDLAVGQVSPSVTLYFRDPTGRTAITLEDAAAAIPLASLLQQRRYPIEWAEQVELGFAQPLAHQLLDREALPALATALFRARSVVIFSGAGVSTDSGIPSYRGSITAFQGATPLANTWDKYDPADEFIDNFSQREDSRRRYWQRYVDLQEIFEAAQPNPSHHIAAYLQATGRLRKVITTNVDSLYDRAGVTAAHLIHLHGISHLSKCLAECPHATPLPTLDIVQTFAATGQDPRCAHCQAPLKPMTISFGQPLTISLEPQSEIHELITSSDLLLVMGSSLSVAPSNKIPGFALAQRIPTALINRDPTHYDPFVDFLLHDPLSGEACAQLLQLLQSWDLDPHRSVTAPLLPTELLDLHFSRWSYARPNTFAPAAADRQLFTELHSTGFPQSPAASLPQSSAASLPQSLVALPHLWRWFHHMAAFSAAERDSWS